MAPNNIGYSRRFFFMKLLFFIFVFFDGDTKMNIEIKRFTTKDCELATKAFKIRTMVFVKEQNVDPDIEYDFYENQCQHYLVYADGKAIGAARWRKTSEGIRLERFSILPEYRNKGIGDKLLKTVMEDVIPLNEVIYLHSQVKSLNLYKRNGFEIFDEPFMEAGIKHYYMEYTGAFKS